MVNYNLPHIKIYSKCEYDTRNPWQHIKIYSMQILPNHPISQNIHPNITQGGASIIPEVRVIRTLVPVCCVRPSHLGQS